MSSSNTEINTRQILITSQKGGSGKTSCALNIGVLASADARTLLLDCDPQGSLKFWHDRRDASQPEVVACSLNNLRDHLEGVKDLYEYIFIDTPPHAYADIELAMRPADLVVVPVRATSLDLHAAETTLRMAAGMAKRTIVVLTQCQPPRLLQEAPSVREARATVASLGCRVASQAIVHRIAVEESVALGKAVSEYDPNGQSHLEFRNLWRQLRTELRLPENHGAATKRGVGAVVNAWRHGS